LKSLHWLGEAYFKQGEFAKAARKFQQAHSGYVELLGENHADTLEVLDRLGKAYAKQGDYTNARDVYQQAYDGHKEAKGEGHPFTIGFLLAIGDTLVDQGDFVNAARTFRQVFNGYKAIERKSDGANQENDRMVRWSLLQWERLPTSYKIS
jgi:TolA-binding protein